MAAGPMPDLIHAIQRHAHRYDAALSNSRAPRTRAPEGARGTRGNPPVGDKTADPTKPPR